MLPITIIIPSYNRPHKLATCLETLTQLDYPPDLFDIIIVDDGSPTPYDSIVQQYQTRLNIRLLRKDNGGPASARNYASEHVTKPYIAFTDDDCYPDPSWLRLLSTALYRCPDAMVGGHTVNMLTNNPYSATSQLIADVVYRHYNRDPEHATFFASNNIAIPTQKFREIGKFDSVFYKAASEDRELCDRWVHKGWRMIYVPDAIINHAHDLSLISFIRQHINYGRGAYHFHRVRSRRQSGSIRRETEFHLNMSNWLFEPIHLASSRREKIRTFAMLMVWQVANAVGYFYELGKHRLVDQHREKQSAQQA